MRKPIAERFETKVDRSGGPGACHLWRAAHDDLGYGMIGAGGRGAPVLRAHRVAWELARGPVPAGALVLHSCDRPACVNVAHLRIGDRMDNAADARERDRHLRGSRCVRAKITEADVPIIRQRAVSGETYREIGRRFGLSRGAVGSIVTGRRWAHVGPGDAGPTSDEGAAVPGA